MNNKEDIGGKIEEEFNNLQSEMDLHHISWVLNKPCKCKSDECKHYEKEKEEVFGKIIQNIFMVSFKLNALEFGSVFGT